MKEDSCQPSVFSRQSSRIFCAAALLLAASAAAQQYPSRAIRIVVPLAPGGNLDIVARALAQSLGESMGQQIVVDNRPGASSLVGTQLVAKSPPDGYTLLAMANTFATVPSLMANPGYDALKDFSGVSLTCLVPMALVVNPAMPVRSVKELVQLAKARPGQVSYATAGIGATGHIAAELFNRHAGIKMLHVPYKGNSQAIVDVIAGQVTMMFDQVSTSIPYISSGKLRGIAVTSLKRSSLVPDLPTIDESGVPGYEEVTFNGLVAPAGTAREILARLNSEITKAVNAPELHKRFLERGVELTASPSPDAFTAYIKAEFVKKAKLVREAGIRIE
ncbi:MAG TPA: tripartite tricarboxylate transporter substrate binding protein [Burkholderiales bacterium]|nr:tripartite tricarboxylate transporter substrate binding protein [Burkholderiales bacterium]